MAASVLALMSTRLALMLVGKMLALIPTSIPMMATWASIDVHSVSISGVVPWLLQSLVENHHSSRMR